MVMVAIGRSILSSVGTVTENAKDREEEVLNDGVIIGNIYAMSVVVKDKMPSQLRFIATPCSV